MTATDRSTREVTMSDTATQSGLEDPNGRPVLRPTLHHTGNFTTRLDEMLEWYRNVVGMEITLSPSSFEGHFVTNDATHHRMSFIKPPGLKPDPVRDAACVNHTAFEYESVDDLLESWERLKELGILPHTAVDHGPTFAFYYWDPDGNNVELLADAYGDWGRSMIAMREEPEMVRNPMGKSVDPGKLIEARRKGMPLDELHERSLRGEFGPEAEAHFD
jgi:catechol-2,3-dioxygenase